MINAPKPATGNSPNLEFDDISGPDPVVAAAPPPPPPPQAPPSQKPPEATVVDMQSRETEAPKDVPPATDAAPAQSADSAIDDLIGDVDSFLGAPKAEEPAPYKASPQADFRYREFLAEANGDPQRAALLLAERYEAAARELEEAKGLAVGASTALEELFPADVQEDVVKGNIRYDLAMDARQRFEAELEERVRQHLQNPKSRFQGFDAEDIREGLRQDFEMSLPAYVERVLPVAFDNHVARHKAAREERLKKFTEGRDAYASKFREEQMNAARKLDQRVDALKAAIGDNPVLRHLAYLELSKPDGPADDRERFAAAEQRYFQEMASAFKPETYAKNDGLRDAARRAVINDPQVKAGISRAIAKGVAAELAKRGIADTPKDAAPVRVTSTDTSITRGSGWGRRPEQGGISEYTFDDAMAGR